MKFFSSQGTHLKSRPELRCFVGASGDDFHLLLGMTKRSIQQIAGTIGFTPEGYSRKAAFEKCGKSDYITPMCGPELTGYDFIESIKLWMTDTNNREWSVAEVWLSRKDRGVGMATLFVSHVQAQPLEATLKAVPDDAHLWLDYRRRYGEPPPLPAFWQRPCGQMLGQHLSKLIGYVLSQPLWNSLAPW
eukprot:5174846-Pyramimonas_sp.AAC.1